MISTNENFLYYFTDFGLKKMSLDGDKLENDFYDTKQIYHHNGQPFYVQEDEQRLYTIHNGSLEVLDIGKIEKKNFKISKNIRSVFNLKATSSTTIEVFLCDSRDHESSYIRSLAKKTKIYKFEKNKNVRNFHLGTIEGTQLCYLIYTFFSSLYIIVISLSTGKVVQKSIKSIESVKTKKIQKVDNNGPKLYIFYPGGVIIYDTLNRSKIRVELPLTSMYSLVKKGQKMNINTSEKISKDIYTVDLKNTLGQNVTPIHLQITNRSNVVIVASYKSLLSIFSFTQKKLVFTLRRDLSSPILSCLDNGNLVSIPNFYNNRRFVKTIYDPSSNSLKFENFKLFKKITVSFLKRFNDISSLPNSDLLYIPCRQNYDQSIYPQRHTISGKITEFEQIFDNISCIEFNLKTGSVQIYRFPTDSTATFEVVMKDEEANFVYFFDNQKNLIKIDREFSISDCIKHKELEAISKQFVDDLRLRRTLAIAGSIYFIDPDFGVKKVNFFSEEICEILELENPKMACLHYNQQDRRILIVQYGIQKIVSYNLEEEDVTKKVKEYLLENQIFPKYFEKKKGNYLYRAKIHSENEILSFKIGSYIKEIQCFTDSEDSQEQKYQLSKIYLPINSKILRVGKTFKNPSFYVAWSDECFQDLITGEINAFSFSKKMEYLQKLKKLNTEDIEYMSKLADTYERVAYNLFEGQLTFSEKLYRLEQYEKLKKYLVNFGGALNGNSWNLLLFGLGQQVIIFKNKKDLLYEDLRKLLIRVDKFHC